MKDYKEKARKRDNKRRKRRYGHRTSGRSVFLWLEQLRKRGNKTSENDNKE